MMLFDLKSLRLETRLSQVKLAHVSGVSLPTIQNIEAKKANPSLDILAKLTKALGIEIKVSVAPFDPDTAALLGVPLVANKILHSTKVYDQKNILKSEARKWHHLLKNNSLNERDCYAIVAYLMALKDHYPTFFSTEISTKVIDQQIETHRNIGKIIKLRRIALASMSTFL